MNKYYLPEGNYFVLSGVVYIKYCSFILYVRLLNIRRSLRKKLLVLMSRKKLGRKCYVIWTTYKLALKH